MKSKVDPILKEVWQIKDAMAARHGGDPHAMATELRRQQAVSGRNVVSLPPRRVQHVAAKR